MILSSITIGTGFMALMLLLLFLGVNIGFTFTVIGVAGYAVIVSPTAATGLLRTIFYTTASNYSYSVVPLFILMGEFCYRSGMSSGLYNAANKWLSWLPGGLACANLAACAGFGAICGSLAATTATMGTVAIPEMRRHGYDDGLSCGSVAAGGTLGILIPPSTCLIVYGIAADEPIGPLFMAGVVPGIICTIIMIITVVIWVRLRPGVAPAVEHVSWKDRISSLKGLIGIVVLFGITFGGMFGGIFTINEAAGVGAFLGAVIMLINRQMTWKNLRDSLLSTLKTTGMVYLLLMGANVLVAFLAVCKLPAFLSNLVISWNISGYLLIAGITVLYLILGCFIDGISIILLTVPIFIPIITAYGFSPVWFGIVVTLASQVGAITPPVGFNCYVLAGTVKDIPLSKIFRGSVPFIIPLVVMIAIVTFIPELATWLPSMMG